MTARRQRDAVKEARVEVVEDRGKAAVGPANGGGDDGLTHGAFAAARRRGQAEERRKPPEESAPVSHRLMH